MEETFQRWRFVAHVAALWLWQAMTDRSMVPVCPFGSMVPSSGCLIGEAPPIVGTTGGTIPFRRLPVFLPCSGHRQSHDP